MPAALVTGGAVVGSTLTGLLLERDTTCASMTTCRAVPGNLDEFDVELVVGDVRDLNADRAAQDATCFSSGRRGEVVSRSEPLVSFDQNGRGTVCASRRRAWGGGSAGRLLVVQRAAGAGRHPASEEKPVAPLAPTGPQGGGEAYCSAYHGAYGLNAVAVLLERHGPRSRTKGTSSRSSSAASGRRGYGGLRRRDADPHFVYVSDRQPCVRPRPDAGGRSSSWRAASERA
jgi:hypothetical protein